MQSRGTQLWLVLCGLFHLSMHLQSIPQEKHKYGWLRKRASLGACPFSSLKSARFSVLTKKSCLQNPIKQEHAVQVFWFRHIFLLSVEDADAVEQLVVQLLADKKLEVQELAARTLSGLIQVC